jgi:Gas vesicle synthesis protein GvpL/GvpF
MAEYVYGIVGQSTGAPAEPGIAGAALRLIPGRSAAALVSDVSSDALRLGRSEALAHARVLEAALEHGTVLPMRFGVVMEDPDEVRRRLLSDHDEQLRDQLESFAGKVELNLRVLYDEPALMRQVLRSEPEIARLREALRGQPEDATYFERIRLGELVAQAVERTRESDAQSIVDALAPAAVSISVGEPAHERVALSASFLVERDRLDAFDQLLEQVAAQRADRMRFKYTGPLPPHSFVQLSGSA